MAEGDSLVGKMWNAGPDAFEKVIRWATTAPQSVGTPGTPDYLKLNLPNELVSRKVDTSRLVGNEEALKDPVAIKAALGTLGNLLRAKGGGVDPAAAKLLNSYAAELAPKYNLSDAAASQFHADVLGNKITDFKKQVPESYARILAALQNQRLLAGDPNGAPMGGMSVAKFMGHTLQAGVLGGTALAIPYAIKRWKQHKDLQRELEEDPAIKTAAVGDGTRELVPWPFMKETDQGFGAGIKALWDKLLTRQTAKAYYGSNGVAPSIVPWRAYSNLVPALGLGTLMAAGKLSNNAALSLIDKESDKVMEKHEDEQRRKIVRLMTASKATKEDGTKQAAFANPVEGTLLALWLAMAPAFYGLGKRIGGATSDADRDAKLEKAFDKARREQPRSLVYSIGDELKVNHGNYLGQTRVTLPVRDKEEEKRKQQSALFA